MPYAAKQPCSGGCGRLVGHGRCAGCQAKRPERQRKTSAQRGYGYRWQKSSKLWLQAHPLAVDYFGTHDGVVKLAEVVDHIVPHRGDMQLFWDPNNWQGLTKEDHDRKTALEDGGFGR
jgi:5-methylcytosine-specific restriction protein A